MSERITGGQILSLKSAYREVVKNVKDDEALYITMQLLPDISADKLSDMTRDDWKDLRGKLYPHWGKENWTCGDEVKREIANAHEKYVEQITGQMRMF